MSCRSSNPPRDAGRTPPALPALTLDEKRMVVTIRKYLELHPPEPPSWWVMETIALIYGKAERRWLSGQWQTVDVSTGKPMKLDSVIQWWTSLTGQASPTDG